MKSLATVTEVLLRGRRGANSFMHISSLGRTYKAGATVIARLKKKKEVHRVK